MECEDAEVSDNENSNEDQNVCILNNKKREKENGKELPLHMCANTESIDIFKAVAYWNWESWNIE